MALKYFDASSVAKSVPFDNTANIFAATDAQSAIEEARSNSSVVVTFFGSGNDGNVSLSSGTTTLSRDMYYNSLTLSGTAILDTNGYRIFCKGTISISGNASIQHNGNNGTNAVGNVAGSAGAAQTGVTVGGGQAGTAGAAVNADSTGTAALTGYGAAGGQGGQGGNNTPPGSVGAYTFIPEYGFREEHFIPGSAPTYKNGGGGGTGGCGGNQPLFATAGAGGGGGGGAGVIYIFCRTFTNTSSVGIQAKGGNGGNGGNATGGSNGCGGGGGGGGGGGFIYLFCVNLTLGNISVAGGTGGTAGTGVGTGPAGAVGASGSTGHYTIFQGSNETWTVL